MNDLGQENPKTPSKSTPTQPYKTLHSHKQSYNFNKSFQCRPLVVKLNYLENCCRPDIAYATYQCDCFSLNPKTQHAKALLHFGRYLKGTMDKGKIYYPNINKGLEVHVYAYFAGNWYKEDSENTDNAR